MKRTMAFGLVLAFGPAALAAQASGQVRAAASGSARVESKPAAAAAAASGDVQGRFRAPKGWSASGSARLEAMYDEARSHEVPPEPIARRVAEGQAKGASETTILASAEAVKARLEASHEAMVSAGRKPAPAETERGATAMEHGVTKVQLEAMAKHTPSDRSLVVAFDVLGRLAARGVPVGRALAEVQGKLDARASDAAIVALAPGANTTASVGGTAAGRASAPGTAVSGAATAAAGATAGSATAGVAGAVTGVVKKP